MTQNELRLWGFFLFLVFIFSGDPDVWDAVKNRVLFWGVINELASPCNGSQVG